MCVSMGIEVGIDVECGPKMSLPVQLLFDFVEGGADEFPERSFVSSDCRET